MNLELQRAIFSSTVAFLLGYFAFWFLYGIDTMPLLLLVLIVAAAVAFFQRQLSGVGQFLALLLALIVFGGFLWGLYAIPIFASYGETFFAVPIIVTPMFLLVMVVIIFRKHIPRWIRFATASPFAPWMFMLGVLIFAFFPAVRVDCRDLQQSDSFMRYGSGFAGMEGQNYWGHKPERIVDLIQLPTGFKPDVVRAVATSCNYNQNFGTRVFSFEASRPLILVHLIVLKNLQVRQSYGALFTPITHKKLTAWLVVKAPYPYGADTPPSEYKTYPLPGSMIYPYSPLPPQVLLEAFINAQR